MNQKGIAHLILIPIVLVVVAGIGGGAYYFTSKSSNEAPNATDSPAVPSYKGSGGSPFSNYLKSSNQEPSTEQTEEQAIQEHLSGASTPTPTPIATTNPTPNPTPVSTPQPTTNATNNKSPVITDSVVIATTSDFQKGENRASYAENDKYDIENIKELNGKYKNFKDEYTFIFIVQTTDPDGYINKVQLYLNDKLFKEIPNRGVNYSKLDKWDGDDLKKAQEWGKSYVSDHSDDDPWELALEFNRNEKLTSGYNDCKFRSGLRMVFVGIDTYYDVMARDPENFAICYSGDNIVLQNYFMARKERLDKGDYKFYAVAVDNNGATTKSNTFEFNVE